MEEITNARKLLSKLESATDADIEALVQFKNVFNDPKTPIVDRDKEEYSLWDLLRRNSHIISDDIIAKLIEKIYDHTTSDFFIVDYLTNVFSGSTKVWDAVVEYVRKNPLRTNAAKWKSCKLNTFIGLEQYSDKVNCSHSLLEVYTYIHYQPKLTSEQIDWIMRNVPLCVWERDDPLNEIVKCGDGFLYPNTAKRVDLLSDLVKYAPELSQDSIFQKIQLHKNCLHKHLKADTKENVLKWLIPYLDKGLDVDKEALDRIQDVEILDIFARYGFYPSEEGHQYALFTQNPALIQWYRDNDY